MRKVFVSLMAAAFVLAMAGAAFASPDPDPDDQRRGHRAGRAVYRHGRDQFPGGQSGRGRLDPRDRESRVRLRPGPDGRPGTVSLTCQANGAT